MKIVLVGAGNLATNLGVALTASAHGVAQVWSRTELSARQLGERLGSPFTADIASLLPADLYIISVCDSALADMAAQVCKRVDELVAQGLCTAPIIAHTAGSMPMDIIPSPRRAVFYPMQTFSKQRIVDFRSIPVFVEAATEDNLVALERLGQELSEYVRRLSSADRAYLHLAAVFCSNFVNHCYAVSAEILRQHGVDFFAMLPLIDEVARKVHTVEPMAAQTGPAVRNDANVVNKHESMLADNQHFQMLYRLLSQSIQQLHNNSEKK